jgi:hypothetical protein
VWAVGFTLDRLGVGSLDLRGMNKRSAGHAPEDQTRLFVGFGAKPQGHQGDLFFPLGQRRKFHGLVMLSKVNNIIWFR